MRSKSVDKRIFTYLLTLLALLMVVYFIFNSTVNNELDELTEQSLVNLAEQQNSAFNVEIEKERDNLESIAKAVSTFDYDDDIIAYINQVKNVFDFTNLLFSDIDGKGITTDGTSVDVSKMSYYEPTINGEIVNTHPYFSNYSNLYVVSVSVPVYRDDEIVGIVAAEYNVDYLNEILKNTSNINGFSLVVDTNANILFSTDTTVRERIRLEETKYDGDVSATSVLDDFANQKSNVITLDIDNERKIAVYSPLDYNDWYIVYIVNESAVNQTNNSISLIMYFVSLITVLGFSALVIYIMHNKRKSLEEIEQVAYFDDLTGLRNLIKFKIDVVNELHKNENKIYCMLKADVINFKAINELYDYETGDLVIETMAKVCKEMEKEGAITARMASDEFILFIEQNAFTDIQSMRSMYEAKFKEMLNYIENHQFDFRFGRYVLDKDERNINDMISRTNMAHSFAKVNASKLLCDYDETFKNQIVDATKLTNKMEYALHNNEFKVFLQPKNNTETGEIIGAEALVRWIEKSGKINFPNDFIPLFESNGFICKLDRYMFESVCALLKKWMLEDRNIIPISVNFSRANLRNPNFVKEIKELVDIYEIPPRYLEIELTETITLNNEQEAQELFVSLKEQGFLVSIDDFGSGYSSLGMLKNLNVDTLKLDRSFFTDTDERGYIVINDIINLAHNLDMFVTAEGIEQAEQIEFLKSIGCDAAQGYYFAKPTTVEEFEKMLYNE